MTDHYKEASIEVKSVCFFCYDFKKGLQQHRSLIKGRKGKIDIKGTMPLWRKNCVTTMKKKWDTLFFIKKKKQH